MINLFTSIKKGEIFDARGKTPEGEKKCRGRDRKWKRIEEGAVKGVKRKKGGEKKGKLSVRVGREDEPLLIEALDIFQKEGKSGKREELQTVGRCRLDGHSLTSICN
jgi:hypothetical protein